MTVFDSSIGIVAETVYGTYLAPSRTIEFNSEGLIGKYDRTWSPGLRAGRTTYAENQFQPIPMGAEGPLVLNPQSKGFGLLLSHMLGSSAIGTLISGHYLQTHTVGSLVGKSLTVQVNRPFVNTGGGVFSYPGTKIKSWSLGCQTIGGLVDCSLALDARQEDTSQALAAVAYPSAPEPFVGVGATVTVDGSTFNCAGFTVTGDNALNTVRFKIGSTGGRKDEPIETSFKKFGGTVTGADFLSLAQYNKIASATAAGALASITITCLGLTDTAASLTITMPKCVILGDIPTVTNTALLLLQNLSFQPVQSSGGTSPITIAYNAVDTAI